MRFKKYLKERYFKGVEGIYSGDYIEVFENPSKKEFLEVSKAGERIHHKDPKGNIVRFFVDMKKKKVYIHSASYSHGETWAKFGDERSAETDPTLLTGVAKQEGGKWVMKTSDSSTVNNLDKYPPEKWEWADKYVLITSLLKQIYSGKISYKGY